jgi:uncharacterized surface protein with fasciclin (FAS1) repeats
MKKALLVVVAVLVAATGFATGTVEYSDPVTIAEQAGTFDTLLTALDAAGLTETLQGDGPFTIFAPTDAAFAAVPAEVLDALLSDTELLTQVLLYHVAGRDIRASEVTSTDGAVTLQGETVDFSVQGGSAYVNDARVTSANINTSNGVLHAIDAVLLPPSVNVAALLAPGDIVDIAVADGRFQTLVTAVQAAGLEETLRSDGPFTVFAPTDDAFAALPAGTVPSLLNDIPALSEILLYHVVSGAVYAEQVVELSNATTVQGQPVVITLSGGSVIVNDAQVVITDIQATNGVIHVIDSVITPPTNNIVEALQEDGRFSTLLTAATAAGLGETLSTGGPFTLFAPTDEAFLRLPAGTVQSLLNDIPTLSDILLYHVVDGAVFSGDVVTLDSAPSVQGESIQIGISRGAVTLDSDATVIGVDTLATNGVIHVIDRVILPDGE